MKNPSIKKSLQRLVQRLLLKRGGLIVIPEWRASRWEMASHLAAILRLLDIDSVLDVGANQGQYYDFLRTEVGYRGPVVSFEPIPALADMLARRQAGEQEWKVYPYALGSEPGVRMLNVMARSDFSSFLEPDHSVVHEDLIRTANRVQARIEVPVRRLDSVLRELGSRFNRILLKLDTQGSELDVVKGIGNDMGRIAAIAIEASVRPIYQGMPGYFSTLHLLDELGFDLSGVFPVSRDAEERLIEIDCVALNRAFLGSVDSRPSASAHAPRCA